jgi:hypothetical protein
MKRIITIAIIALSLAATSALAGTKVYAWLTIDMNSRFASGALGDVRAEPDPDAYLSCYSVGLPGISNGGCFACNAKDCVFAYTFEPEVVAAIRSLDSNTGVSFEWLASGELKYLWSEAGSQFTPIEP